MTPCRQKKLYYTQVLSKHTQKHSNMHRHNLALTFPTELGAPMGLNCCNPGQQIRQLHHSQAWECTYMHTCVAAPLPRHTNTHGSLFLSYLCRRACTHVKTHSYTYCAKQPSTCQHSSKLTDIKHRGAQA